MGKAPKKVDTSTLEDWPPGMLPDGKLHTVKRDDPPFEPEIVDDEGNELEAGED